MFKKNNEIRYVFQVNLINLIKGKFISETIDTIILLYLRKHLNLK